MIIQDLLNLPRIEFYAIIGCLVLAFWGYMQVEKKREFRKQQAYDINEGFFLRIPGFRLWSNIIGVFLIEALLVLFVVFCIRQGEKNLGLFFLATLALCSFFLVRSVIDTYKNIHYPLVVNRDGITFLIRKRRFGFKQCILELSWKEISRMEIKIKSFSGKYGTSYYPTLYVYLNDNTEVKKDLTLFVLNINFINAVNSYHAIAIECDEEKRKEHRFIEYDMEEFKIHFK